MKVFELIEKVTADELEAKQRVAYRLLKVKLSEVRRAKKILDKLESELEELKNTDVEDLECDYYY